MKMQKYLFLKFVQVIYRRETTCSYIIIPIIKMLYDCYVSNSLLWEKFRLLQKIWSKKINRKNPLAGILVVWFKAGKALTGQRPGWSPGERSHLILWRLLIFQNWICSDSGWKSNINFSVEGKGSSAPAASCQLQNSEILGTSEHSGWLAPWPEVIHVVQLGQSWDSHTRK